MDRLADELIQLIFDELDNPYSFALLSKRYYNFSQDPYVRAHYFLWRYGRTQALYWALGRGKLVNEKFIDILLNSGAHLSRYLVQVAVHHYFRSSAHFIKTPWVRSIPFPIFTYFMSVAAARLGNIPTGKGDDDGTLFTSFIKESRLPVAMRSTKADVILEILEKYKFIPFCSKDPIMAQFPLALAVEPRLLPLARANGFHMDSRYRDFVFRRMFERSSDAADHRTGEVLHNVRELCRLDSNMFISRTVAAEVLMEAQTNEPGYVVLKTLDRAGELKFELSSVVEALIKLFVKTRSVTAVSTVNALRHLWKSFPSKDPTARLVMLLTVFIPVSPTSLQSQLEGLNLTPISKQDIFRVMVNPFVERFFNILAYAKEHCGIDGEGAFAFIKEVAIHCLEIPYKGKMLKALYREYPALEGVILDVVTREYQINLEDLPLAEDEATCDQFDAKLCRELTSLRNRNVLLEHHLTDAADSDESGSSSEEDELDDVDDSEAVVSPTQAEESNLGQISQETLSQVIRQDELGPTGRHRRYSWMTAYPDFSAYLPYPAECLQVGRWIRTQFGNRHPITAVFMTHAVINDNPHVLPHYTTDQVPVTLKHFKLLARLGRCPSSHLFRAIQLGAEFFFSEEDYLGKDDLEVKKETSPSADVIPSTSSRRSSSTNALPSGRGKPGKALGGRRPRRTAAAVKSYLVPDSDDEDIADEKPAFAVRYETHKRKIESNLQRWIKHLSILQKEEQKRYNEKKKQLERENTTGIKLRVPKNEFLKALASNLKDLRKADQAKRHQLYGPDAPPEDYSEGDDDEYQFRTRPTKRRKLA